MKPKFVVGIDLGTTNSVIAYSAIEEGAAGTIQLLAIPQKVDQSSTESNKSLPSFAYLKNENEAGDDSLPGLQESSAIVGSYARDRSAEVPNRTVVGAKSWLCHSKIDRRAPCLPFQAPDEVQKISPVEATRLYLNHLVAAWNEAHPEHPMEQQSVVLTVPASFDPVARELTRESAIAAGLPQDFTLLEEPQAALYAWLDKQGDQWREQLQVGNSILVCDVGGGTTDLTLVVVEEDQGNLALHRIAVGNHLLVGGDNMDLTAAHFVANLLNEKGTKLNPWQSVSLWHSCRKAKESLLQSDGPDQHKISVLGRGSKLIGGTVSIEVDRKELANILLEGFFPSCKLTDQPVRQQASGFQEIGLPFESDPAITRHVAEFVSRLQDELDNRIPDFVVFNGGVFKAEGFRNRMLETINQWGQGDKQSQMLGGVDDLDDAVARGACYYGLNKLTGGIRIRGGVAHSYYVGIESAGLAIPGMPRPLKALCVVPHGMEEGTQVKVPSTEIGLVVGQPVRFRFFRSNKRPEDQPGTLLDQWEDQLEESAPLQTTLAADGLEDPMAAVTFTSRITELGMFELWCDDARQSHQWKLEFNVREERS